MDITLRDATPDDADFIAWVQVEASRSGTPLGFWDVALPGPDAPRIATVARVVAAPRESFVHVSGFVVAEQGGQPVAAMSAYDPGKKKLGHFISALNSTLALEGWSEAHLGLLGHRLSPVVACLSDAQPGMWVIEWVAAKPEARGKGVAQCLLDLLLERGRSLGYHRAQISYLLGNNPAQRCYERAGFRVVDDKRHPDFEAIFGAPGTARMLCEL